MKPQSVKPNAAKHDFKDDAAAAASGNRAPEFVKRQIISGVAAQQSGIFAVRLSVFKPAAGHLCCRGLYCL
ncbi:MAG: hypothetical protein VB055_07420 [Oscillospiraceae bacterium]|nr:hypothetical protein [Oscillospiraceae bacterium]